MPKPQFQLFFCQLQCECVVRASDDRYKPTPQSSKRHNMYITAITSSQQPAASHSQTERKPVSQGSRSLDPLRQRSAGRHVGALHRAAQLAPRGVAAEDAHQAIRHAAAAHAHASTAATATSAAANAAAQAGPGIAAQLLQLDVGHGRGASVAVQQQLAQGGLGGGGGGRRGGEGRE